MTSNEVDSSVGRQFIILIVSLSVIFIFYKYFGSTCRQASSSTSLQQNSVFLCCANKFLKNCNDCWPARHVRIISLTWQYFISKWPELYLSTVLTSQHISWNTRFKKSYYFNVKYNKNSIMIYTMVPTRVNLFIGTNVFKHFVTYIRQNYNYAVYTKTHNRTFIKENQILKK